MISAWALIAFQSAKATGASKLVTFEMCAAAGTSRKRPVPGEVVDDDLGDLPGELRRRAAVGDEGRHREGHRLDDALGDLDPERRLRHGSEGPQGQGRRHADEQVAPETVYHDTIPSGLKTTSMFRHCAYLSRGRSV